MSSSGIGRSSTSINFGSEYNRIPDSVFDFEFDDDQAAPASSLSSSIDKGWSTQDKLDEATRLANEAIKADKKVTSYEITTSWGFEKKVVKRVVEGKAVEEKVEEQLVEVTLFDISPYYAQRPVLLGKIGNLNLSLDELTDKIIKLFNDHMNIRSERIELRRHIENAVSEVNQIISGDHPNHIYQIGYLLNKHFLTSEKIALTFNLLNTERSTDKILSKSPFYLEFDIIPSSNELVGFVLSSVSKIVKLPIILGIKTQLNEHYKKDFELTLSYVPNTQQKEIALNIEGVGENAHVKKQKIGVFVLKELPFTQDGIYEEFKKFLSAFIDPSIDSDYSSDE